MDLGRDELRKLLNDKMGIAIATFRGNVSKLNRKIKEALSADNLLSYYEINSSGIRGAKFYGIQIPSKKIKIE